MLVFAPMQGGHRVDDEDAGRLAGGKDGVQAVVIFLRNRVKFVVVAAGALERQAKKCRPGGVHCVGQPFMPEPGPVQL